MAWAWWRRTKRDASPLIQPGELPAAAAVLATFETLYVATTKHGRSARADRRARPRHAVGRATVTVADAGVAIDLTGQPRFVLTPDRIVYVGQSTVAIDRVVETGGLTKITWRTDAGSTVDSYFRPQDASARALADAVGGILTTTSPTGTDA